MKTHMRSVSLMALCGAAALLMSAPNDPGDSTPAGTDNDTPNPLTDGAAAIDPVNVDPDAAGEPADPVEHDKAPADGGQPEAGQPTEG